MLSHAATLISWIVGFAIAIAVISFAVSVILGILGLVGQGVENCGEAAKLRADSRKLLRREKSPDENIRFPPDPRKPTLEEWKNLLRKK